MTIHQQAHGLIDMLSEESAEVMVQVMLRMLPYDKRPVYAQSPSEEVRQAPAQKPFAVSAADLDASANPDPLLLSLLAGKKGNSLADADSFAEDMEEFNKEMTGIFGKESV